MRPRLCHLCGTPGRFLPDSSADADVEYYRCDICHAVWCYDRSTPDKGPNSVTRPRSENVEAESEGGEDVEECWSTCLAQGSRKRQDLF
jgi:hypothetical protein